MKKILMAFVVTSALCMHAAADTNVALNGAVSLTGTGFGTSGPYWDNRNLAAPATVTDDLFLQNGTQWNIGTVFWYEAGDGTPTNFINIDLKAAATINRITLQAGNNDDYGINYLNLSNTWQQLATISPYRGWGMDMGTFDLAKPIIAKAFQISRVHGDGAYSVSEFQAFGNVAAVPEPETYALMTVGLGLLGLTMRRKKQATA